ncbi:MAG: 2Fe-2S iron-sulfur cluster-binding protein [Mucilaginibacter sp.]|uniref:2Fe-2S iron-sulfur cluster-binding protein n=1 Tax=Mucilaginibacter sp. TaxID=1882438 RepID=UPI003264248B
MSIEKNTILLVVYYRDESYPIQTYPNECYSLMTLISDKLAILGFGLCCGMGSCGTCLVQISDQYTTLKKNVLACDIRVNDNLANTHIIIPDNGY